jgi:hypothetical protein
VIFRRALNAPGKIVITQSIAQKYFGIEKPLGKILKVGDADFEVTGVTKNVPSIRKYTLILQHLFQALLMPVKKNGWKPIM